MSDDFSLTFFFPLFPLPLPFVFISFSLHFPLFFSTFLFIHVLFIQLNNYIIQTHLQFTKLKLKNTKKFHNPIVAMENPRNHSTWSGINKILLRSWRWGVTTAVAAITHHSHNNNININSGNNLDKQPTNSSRPSTPNSDRFKQPTPSTLFLDFLFFFYFYGSEMRKEKKKEKKKRKERKNELR
ncbi:hypothetical protein ACB094_12G050800 [Castanea mollissima]